LSVLIRGETGVGKEVCAESLHRMSNRADRPFLRINCAALSETLLESELFGHERGAFTGAHTAKPGLLETADTGMVFLDEIGEIPPNLQAKLLRVLEDGVVTRVGGLKRRTIDVRFIAATNVDIEAAIEANVFRSDLYFRLGGVTLDIPPLRERVGEIEGLSRLFLERACARAGRVPTPELTPAALERLRTYSWPGNIRELRNTIERAALVAPGSTIDVTHLAVEHLGRTSGVLAAGATSPLLAVNEVGLPAVQEESEDAKSDLLKRLADLEKRELEETLASCGGNQTRAAKLLGISRTTLQARMIAHGIPRPRKRPKG
jgi:transcriptional regulator with PAS, ATPase and Fis domain